METDGLRSPSLARLLLAAAILLGNIALPVRAEIYYPWTSTFIGALDARAWPGLVLIPSAESAFAFTLRLESEAGTVEGPDLYYLVSEVGPQSPDGLYARVRLDLGLPWGQGRDTPILMKPAPRRRVLTLEWSRRDERVVIGRIRMPEAVRLAIVNYFPWDVKGAYEVLPDGQVRGRNDVSGKKRFFFRLWMSQAGEIGSAPRGGLAVILPGRGERVLAFAAGVDEDDSRLESSLVRYKNAEAIGALIDEEAAVYESKRVKVRGLFAGVPEAVTNSLHWGVLYQPGQHRLYAPVSREAILPRADGTPEDWTISAIHGFLNPLGLVLESQKLAIDSLKAALETQYPNGNIPSWRGRSSGTTDRSQPPLGGYAVLKLFGRLGDMDILRHAYPILKRWHDYWTTPRSNGRPRRDGNGDGLLEWGTDSDLLGRDLPSWERNTTGRMRSARESGQEDLPNWEDSPFSDETGTLTLNAVDLNSLYALDAWCLAEMASVLGRPVDGERYRDEYERMKALINARLWNEKDGFYADRHWDGRFSTHKAATAFLPLLAGIPDEGQVPKMLKHLLDPKEFWGDYVIPSVSRSDPGFRPDRQAFFRGAIWPSTNYLVYQGLKAYGLDAVASEFARKSADMFLRSWTTFGLSPEHFDSLTGEGGGGRFQSGSVLAALIGVEEYLDFTPREGFRFGMLKPDAKGKLSRVLIQGRHYEVECGNGATVLREEGETLFAADRGVVVRRFLYTEPEVSFSIKALKKVRVKLRFLKKGKYQLLLDGRETDVFSGQSWKFDVPEGDHTVLVQLLSGGEGPTVREAPAVIPSPGSETQTREGGRR